MLYVGIDLHKKSIMVYVVNQERHRVDSKRLACATPERIVAYFETQGEFQAVIEATASYEWLVRLLEPLAQRVRPGKEGRPPYEPLGMLKALYLQRLYDLSDPDLEGVLGDRLSFRRFCGFTLEDGTPDETTILRFRHDAAKAGVLEQCFALVTAQLEAKGLVLRAGTMMDASIIRASANRRRCRQGAVRSMRRSRMPAGPAAAARPCSATRRMSGSTRARAWFGAWWSPRPRSTRARSPTS